MPFITEIIHHDFNLSITNVIDNHLCAGKIFLKLYLRISEKKFHAGELVSHYISIGPNLKNISSLLIDRIINHSPELYYEINKKINCKDNELKIVVENDNPSYIIISLEYEVLRNQFRDISVDFELYFNNVDRAFFSTFELLEKQLDALSSNNHGFLKTLKTNINRG